jgi:hypothetical protein
MSRKSLSSRIVAAAIGSWLVVMAARPCSGEELLAGKPPAEAFQLLGMLAKGEVTGADLRQVIRPVLDERYGTKARIGVILNEAIRQGALRKEEVIAAMESEGCAFDRMNDSTHCGQLATSIRLGLSRPVAASAPRSATGEVTQTDIDRARDNQSEPAGSPQAPIENVEIARARALAQFSAEHAYSGEYDRFVAALVRAGPTPIQEAFRLFTLDSLEQLEGPSDRDAILAMANFEGELRAADAMNHLRGALGRVVEARIARSMGDPAIVADVRGIPQELLDKALDIDRRMINTGNDLGGLAKAVIIPWRQGSVPPNQWEAWKSVLLHSGW